MSESEKVGQHVLFFVCLHVCVRACVCGGGAGPASSALRFSRLLCFFSRSFFSCTPTLSRQLRISSSFLTSITVSSPTHTRSLPPQTHVSATRIRISPSIELCSLFSCNSPLSPLRAPSLSPPCPHRKDRPLSSLERQAEEDHTPV